MASQFEQSEDANDGEKLQDVRIFQVGGLVCQQQVDVETQSCDKVNDIDGALDKLEYFRTRAEPRNVVLFSLCVISWHASNIFQFRVGNWIFL